MLKKRPLLRVQGVRKHRSSQYHEPPSLLCLRLGWCKRTRLCHRSRDLGIPRAGPIRSASMIETSQSPDLGRPRADTGPVAGRTFEQMNCVVRCLQMSSNTWCALWAGSCDKANRTLGCCLCCRGHLARFAACGRNRVGTESEIGLILPRTGVGWPPPLGWCRGPVSNPHSPQRLAVKA